MRLTDYGGLSRSPSFATFVYGCPVNETHKLPIGAQFDVIYSPSKLAAINTPAIIWHKTRFLVVMSEIRKKPCRMLQVVATRPLTAEEIEHHQKLLQEDTDK